MARKHRSRKYWETVINEFKTSGQTRKAFADSRHIKFSSFQYWLYKLRDEQQSSKDVGFVEVVQVAEAPEDELSTWLSLPGGLTMTFDSPPPPAYLAELSRALGRVAAC